jgi:hypothetical protein
MLITEAPLRLRSAKIGKGINKAIKNIRGGPGALRFDPAWIFS